MTQKEALKRALEYNTHIAKIAFVLEWLEDINWHTERSILVERLTAGEVAKLTLLERLNVLAQPQQYNETWRNDPEVKAEIAKHGEAYERLKAVGLLTYDDAAVTKQELQDYGVAHGSYSFFSKLWGWGLDNSWADCNGEKLVDELVEIINARD